MRLIHLHNFHIAFVDDEDYKAIWTRGWYAHRDRNGRLYARNRRLGMMHRYLLSIEDGFEVHHKDGNGLNNTRSNMEVMSKALHRRMHKRKE